MAKKMVGAAAAARKCKGKKGGAFKACVRAGGPGKTKKSRRRRRSK